MTAQIPDSVWFEGEIYAHAGIAGEGLFDPLAHGLMPRPMSTGNWRGFVCGYVVRNGTLRLDRLEVGALPPRPDDPSQDPLAELFGRRPTLEPGRAIYEQLDAPVAFTGGLLLGSGFLQEHYVHMGFHPAWKFEHVVELVFDAGTVVRTHDRSEQLAEIRRQIKKGKRPDPDASVDTSMWIARTFELGYYRSAL